MRRLQAEAVIYRVGMDVRLSLGPFGKILRAHSPHLASKIFQITQSPIFPGLEARYGYRILIKPCSAHCRMMRATTGMSWGQ